MDKDEIIRFVERMKHEVVINHIETELNKKPYWEIKGLCEYHDCPGIRALAVKMYWMYTSPDDSRNRG